MDRYWLLTNTCYGTWLPGSKHGFVGRVWEHRPFDPERPRVVHNVPDTPYDKAMPGLESAAYQLLKGEPIHLRVEHAEIIQAQFRETATIRGWSILALTILFNHFHLVVGVEGDPAPGKILGDFKSWATRTLNERLGKPPSKRWWTERGSKRRLSDDDAVAAAVRYVLYRQRDFLVTWSPETGLRYGS
ncbi:MAG: hypothetical protein KatS3mg105_0797 [Gemmatales bacterium]|nr:MAG: hypothetical protein KatS3mg105_0797 [Gemmatales bacterium]